MTENEPDNNSGPRTFANATPKENLGIAVTCFCASIAFLFMALIFHHGSFDIGMFGYVIGAIAAPILIGLNFIAKYLIGKESASEKTRENLQKARPAILLISTLFIVFGLLCGMFASFSNSSSSSSEKDETSVSDVMKWYDEKDASGNYIHRDEYNKKRSY